MKKLLLAYCLFISYVNSQPLIGGFGCQCINPYTGVCGTYVNCFRNPCEPNPCPNNQQCQSDFCDGCHAICLPSTPSSNQCTLSCGTKVNNGWRGFDEGYNCCNSCQCSNGLLTCSAIGCNSQCNNCQSNPTPLPTTKPTEICVPPDGGRLIIQGNRCQSARFSCNINEEVWFKECGCGCKPKVTTTTTTTLAPTQQRKCKNSHEIFIHNNCKPCSDQCDEQLCITACISGCYCRRGYKRDKNGACVPESIACNTNNKGNPINIKRDKCEIEILPCLYPPCPQIEICRKAPSIGCDINGYCNELPKCVPNGASYFGNPKECSQLNYVCSAAEQHWYDKQCGCGCQPIKVINPPTQQPKICPVNEEYSDCGGCDIPCGVDGPIPCALVCRQGCFCKNGFKRNELSECVTNEQCTAEKCKVNPCLIPPCPLTCESNPILGCDTQGYCKPQPTCVPPNATYKGDPQTCQLIDFICPPNQRPWFNNQCGCGCEPIPTPSPTESQTCKLSCGTIVPINWSGNDEGLNCCNTCRCGRGGILGCTKRGCLSCNSCQINPIPTPKPSIIQLPTPTPTILPKCTPIGGSYIGNPEQCTRILFICVEGQQPWFNNECGCGCEPIPIIPTPNNDPCDKLNCQECCIKNENNQAQCTSFNPLTLTCESPINCGGFRPVNDQIICPIGSECIQNGWTQRDCGIADAGGICVIKNNKPNLNNLCNCDIGEVCVDIPNDGCYDGCRGLPIGTTINTINCPKICVKVLPQSALTQTTTTLPPTVTTFPPNLPINEICLLPMVIGPCRGAFIRWFYDGNKCTTFTYGGCQGNKNNFNTELECKSACFPLPLPSPPKQDRCETLKCPQCCEINSNGNSQCVNVNPLTLTCKEPKLCGGYPVPGRDLNCPSNAICVQNGPTQRDCGVADAPGICVIKNDNILANKFCNCAIGEVCIDIPNDGCYDGCGPVGVGRIVSTQNCPKMCVKVISHVNEPRIPLVPPPPLPNCPINEHIGCCESTCVSDVVCSSICPTNQQKCVCVEGFKRDSEGHCIPLSQCGLEKCITPPCLLNPCPKICQSHPGVGCNNLGFCNPIPSCIPPGGKLIAKPKECLTITLSCDANEQEWFDNECGCGCQKLLIVHPPIHIEKCPINEVFSNCGGCDIPCGVNGPIPCAAICRQGCFCKTGFKRNTEGQCVTDHQCTAEKCLTNPCLVPPCPTTCHSNPKLGCDKLGFCNKPITSSIPKPIPLPPISNDQSASVSPIILPPPLPIDTTKSCKLLCGRIVPNNWSGNDEGNNCCNSCRCSNGVLSCTEIACIGNACKSCPIVTTKTPVCPINEEYSTCGGCDEKCSDVGPIPCTLQCRVGCFCKQGFKRDSNNNCIIANQCPPLTPTPPTPLCPENQIFLPSVNIACPPTCEQPLPLCRAPERPGCGCPTPMVLLGNRCVSFSECSNNCGVNEIFKTCSSCEGTCENPTPICTLECKPPKCECKEGFIRNKQGTCIKQNECPNYREKCIQVQCIRAPCPLLCQSNPSFGCDTLGFCREKPLTQCSTNEIFRECGTCEPSCDNPTPICTRECKPSACQCETGFVRNILGKCVKQNECLIKPKCETHETYKQCSSQCEPTCDNLNPICIQSCGPPKCQCDRGYVRDTNNKCILISNCNQLTTTLAPKPTTCKQLNCPECCELDENNNPICLKYNKLTLTCEKPIKCGGYPIAGTDNSCPKGSECIQYGSTQRDCGIIDAPGICVIKNNNVLANKLCSCAIGEVCVDIPNDGCYNGCIGLPIGMTINTVNCPKMCVKFIHRNTNIPRLIPKPTPPPITNTLKPEPPIRTTTAKLTTTQSKTTTKQPKNTIATPQPPKPKPIGKCHAHKGEEWLHKCLPTQTCAQACILPELDGDQDEIIVQKLIYDIGAVGPAGCYCDSKHIKMGNKCIKLSRCKYLQDRRMDRIRCKCVGDNGLSDGIYQVFDEHCAKYEYNRNKCIIDDDCEWACPD